MDKLMGMRLKGITLLELLLVMSMIAVLTAIAIPGYQDFLIRGKRTIAHAGLLELVSRQTQFYLDNKTYSDDLTNLGYADEWVFSLAGSSAIALDDRQSPVEASASTATYFLQIDTATTDAFTVSAIPQGFQARDTECGILSIDHIGTRINTGTAADCW